MSQDLAIIVINWILGILGLLCVLAIIIGFPGIIIAAIIESRKKPPEGQKKSYKYTIIFTISFFAGIIILIGVMAIWGAAVYLATNI